MSDSTILTPEFRNASSRRRCSSVGKSYSTLVKVAVQAAGNLVGVLVELSARVQLGHDDLGRGNAFALVNVDRNAAAVVAHRHRAVGIEHDFDGGGMAGERFVDR